MQRCRQRLNVIHHLVQHTAASLADMRTGSGELCRALQLTATSHGWLPVQIQRLIQEQVTPPPHAPMHKKQHVTCIEGVGCCTTNIVTLLGC